MNGFSFKGQPRHWYMTPLILGLSMILLSLLILIWPYLLVILIALPLFLAGLAFTLIGMDLWRGATNWRSRVRNVFSRMGPPQE